MSEAELFMEDCKFKSGGSTDGTYLQGTIGATLAELVALFGPSPYRGDSKVTTEWVITFTDGLVAKIYDWKRYELGVPRLNEEYLWSIGGHDSVVARRVTAIVVESVIARHLASVVA